MSCSKQSWKRLALVSLPRLFGCYVSGVNRLLFNMEKFVRQFRSFEETDNAEYEYYRTLSGNEKLQLLLDLIMSQNPDAAIIE